MKWPYTYPMPYIFTYTTFYEPVRLIWPLHLCKLYIVPGVTPPVSNYHNTPSQLCDIVTEDAFQQSLYHPQIKFLKSTNFDSLLFLLVKMSTGLTLPSIFLMEIGLESFLLESTWERNQWYLTVINLLVGVRRGDEATTVASSLS